MLADLQRAFECVCGLQSKVFALSVCVCVCVCVH